MHTDHLRVRRALGVLEALLDDREADIRQHPVHKGLVGRVLQRDRQAQIVGGARDPAVVGELLVPAEREAGERARHRVVAAVVGFEHVYAAFGFGSTGEDDTAGEVSISDKPKARALAALGEQGVTATPAQVLQAYSAIAEQGRVFRFIMPGQNKAPSLERVVPLEESTLAVLRAGLRECVTKGTCRAASVPGVAVAGKTGTAPALDGSHVTQAWFVGYAPASVPQVALVVFLKRGTGSANAAPLAAQILRQYFAQAPHSP